MSDAPTPPAPTPHIQAPRGRRRRVVWRWSRRLILAGVAVAAAIVVTFFTIDIGHLFSLRERAEAAASRFLARPLHIGHLSARLTPGDFVLDDVVIEGLTRDARPFLTAGRIEVHVPWWTIFERRLVLEVRMTDWHMTVETWPDGRQTLPRFALPGGTGKKSFTTTVNYMYADRGEFTYDDHGTPWSVVARNLNVDIVRSSQNAYVGTVRSTGGTVQIQNDLPMHTDLSAEFTVDGPFVRLHHIDLVTDGSTSRISGVVDAAHFPEQAYQVESRIDFERMRQIFFSRESWRVSGRGTFNGSFHLFPHGYQLKGDFASASVGVDDLRFANLGGSLEWQPGHFAVTHAESDAYSGRTSFVYSLDRRSPDQPWGAMFAADYDGLSVQTLSQLAGLHTLDVVGRARGHLALAWTNGHFSETRHGDGETAIAAPEGAAVATADLPAAPRPVAAASDARFDPYRSLGPIPAAGYLRYQFDAGGVVFDDSWIAHPWTYVRFQGRVGADGQVTLPFHATSLDWLESDRLLAAILTERGASTGAIDVGGRGTFDGVMTQSFSDPRFEGDFAGEGIRAWKVIWGRTVGHVVVTKSDVDVDHGVIGDSTAQRIDTSGRFSLGYRKDHGEEIRATFHVEHWPLTDFRTAFGLDSWPITGTGTADLDLHGPYRAPIGSGTLRVDDGSAWRETFETATAALTFEGTGLNLTGLKLTKGAGAVTGGMLINWNGTYAFDANGDHVAIETLNNFKVPKAPLSGQLQFHVFGAGSFEAPVYSFTGHVADLFAGDEGVGDVVGSFAIGDNALTITRLDAASKRLQASGVGRISLAAPYDADLNLSVHDTSIDPYLKFVSSETPEYMRAIVGGSARLSGPLADPAALRVDGTIDDARLTLFDYLLQNDGPIHLTFEHDALTIGHLALTGAETNLAITGGLSRASNRVDLEAHGTANLAILQAFTADGDLRVTGDATINARLAGPLDQLQFAGSADIDNGRLRIPSFTRSLESITGRITFNGDDLDVSGLRAKMGDGDVTFGGAIRFKNYRPVEFDLTAQGQRMNLRYPSGFDSQVDAALTLRGPVSGPTLGGQVTLLRATMRRQLEPDAGVIGIAAAGAVSSGAVAAGPDTSDESTFPLTFDIQVRSAGSLPFVNFREATIYASTNDLTITGTAAQPVITGRIAIDRGEVFLNGNRVTVQPGSIDFTNPLKIDPVYNVQVATHAYLAGQTFNITARLTGTMDKLSPTFTSEPWLPTFDILSLLLGQTPNVLTAEQRSLQSAQAERQLLPTAAAQLLTAPISAQVGSAVERTLPIDAAQITPLFNLDESQQLNPGARVTLGKRISDRLFLTYSRDINQQINELILLEYEESDRVSWVLSRNEDQTFSLDFRIRHVF